MFRVSGKIRSLGLQLHPTLKTGLLSIEALVQEMNRGCCQDVKDGRTEFVSTRIREAKSHCSVQDWKSDTMQL
jgi:hypothetical protein